MTFSKSKKSFASSTNVLIVLVVILPVLTLILGMIIAKKTNNQPNSTVTNRTPYAIKIESPRDLIKRCGTIPTENLQINKGHFTVLDGPVWSPDCRHIAWSLWQSGTSNPVTGEGIGGNGPYSYEGIYIYTESTNQIKQIYTPTEAGESATFQKWSDRNTIIFTKQQTPYKYSLKTGRIKPADVQDAL